MENRAEHEPEPGASAAARARDQIGAFFLVMSLPLAAGAAAALHDPRGECLRHSALWWLAWAAGLAFSGLTFAVVPWAMRRVYAVPPTDAVADAVRAFWILSGASIALLALDAAVYAAARAFAGPGRAAAAAAVAAGALAAVAAPQVLLRGRSAGWPALLPAAAYWNALLGLLAARVVGW